MSRRTRDAALNPMILYVQDVGRLVAFYRDALGGALRDAALPRLPRFHHLTAA